MRVLALAASLLLASLAQAKVTFVSPLEGSQVFGLTLLEVKTDAKNVDRVEFFVDGMMAGVARTAPYRVAYDFGDSMSSRVVSAKVWTNGFTTSESAELRTSVMTASETLNVDLVEVPLRIRSSRALRAADLRVKENGIEQTVRDVQRERPPAHFAFVVDRSLSMGDGKLEAALQAVQRELRQLRQGDTASLVLFNHIVSKPRRLAPGDDLLPIQPVPSGGTSLRDALASVASKERTYAIVITDGGDRNSELSDEEALRRISGARTIVSVIVLGRSHVRFLDDAATKTGGTVVDASARSVGAELARLLEDINSRYLLVYQSHGTERGWRSVDVKPRGRGVTITASRKGYFAE